MDGGSWQEGVLGTIGNTPLVQLNRFLDRDDLDLRAKLEMMNPGGSSKDRAALRMLTQAMLTGHIQPGGLVVESSSGNTAIAMAQFCTLHRLRFRCVVDRHVQAQNLAILRAHGAEVEFIDEADVDGGDLLSARFRRADEIARSTPGAYWPNQHANPDNPRAHELGTMPEILDALDRDPDYLFVALSTTGTALGCQTCLRKRGLHTRVVAVDLEGSALSGGPTKPRLIPGFGAGTVPPLAQNASFEGMLRVSAVDCVVGCRRLVQRESILAGGSAGGVLQAVRRFSRTLPASSVCVAILADGGTRYLDTLYDDGWVAEHLGCPPGELARRVMAPDWSLAPVEEAAPEPEVVSGMEG